MPTAFFAFVTGSQQTQVASWPLAVPSQWSAIVTAFKTSEISDVVSAGGETWGINGVHQLMVFRNSVWTVSSLMGVDQIMTLNSDARNVLYGYLGTGSQPTGVFYDNLATHQLKTLTALPQGFKIGLTTGGAYYNPEHWSEFSAYVAPWVLFLVNNSYTLKECSYCAMQTNYYTNVAAWNPSTGQLTTDSLTYVGSNLTLGTYYPESSYIGYPLVSPSGAMEDFSYSIQWQDFPVQTGTYAQGYVLDTANGTFVQDSSNPSVPMMGAWGYADPQTGGIVYADARNPSQITEYLGYGTPSSIILPSPPPAGVAPYYNATDQLLIVPWSNNQASGGTYQTNAWGVEEITSSGTATGIPLPYFIAQGTTPQIAGLSGP